MFELAITCFVASACTWLPARFETLDACHGAAVYLSGRHAKVTCEPLAPRLRTVGTTGRVINPWPGQSPK
jgi:hypothetical protein